MRIGTDIPSLAPDAATIARIVRDADASDIYSLWAQDHFFGNINFGNVEDPQLEVYTLLGFAAGVSQRVRLGAMVTAAVYRQPGLLGKIVTTLDVLSAGRAYLGIGCAWFEQEALSLGIEFPPLAERFDRMEEVIQVVLQMFAGDDSAYKGRYYRLSRPLNSPGCVQEPHPPLLIAGGGERKTLRMVAQYADACNLLAFDMDTVRTKLEVLKAHCARLNRPYEDIEKTAWVPLPLAEKPTGDKCTPAQAMDTIHEFAEMGVDHVVVYVEGPEEPQKIQLIAELAALARPVVPKGRIEQLPM